MVEPDSAIKQGKGNLYGIEAHIVEVAFKCPCCGGTWGFTDDPKPGPAYSGPDDPKLQEDFKTELDTIIHSGEGLVLELPMLDAHCLLCAIQLASRHPMAKDSLTLQQAIKIAHEIEQYFTTPALAYTN